MLEYHEKAGALYEKATSPKRPEPMHEQVRNEVEYVGVSVCPVVWEREKRAWVKIR